MTTHTDTSPRCSVIVIAYHGKRWIGPCLESLTESFRGLHRVYVVDNSGNEGCIPTDLDNCAYTLLETDRPLGFAEANNFALERLVEPTPYICFLNQDTLCRPGWLDACCRLLDDCPEAGVVSPMLYSFGWDDLNPNFLSCMRASPQLMDDIRSQQLAPSYPIRNVPAAAMVIRSSLLKEVGPFDPIFGSYYEDFDLCLRVRDTGREVRVCTEGEVAHYDFVTESHERTRRNRRRQMLVIRNRVIYDARESGPRRRLTLANHFLHLLPRQMLRSLLRRPGHKPLSSVIAGYVRTLPLLPRLAIDSKDRAAWDRIVADFRRKTSMLGETTAY